MTELLRQTDQWMKREIVTPDQNGSIPRNACVACETYIAMYDYQESVTTGQIDVGQNDPYVSLCFTVDTKKQSF